MSPVYINPEKTEHVDCPMCGFHQAVKNGGGIYMCLGNDNKCRFCGTLEYAEKLKREKEECKRKTALNAAS